MYRIITALVFAMLAALSSAQVYKHVDEEGNVTFTDQPPPNATPVEIGPINTAQPPVIAYPKKAPSEPQASEGASYQVSITAPAHEAIFHGGGSFTVSASVSPALRGVHKLQLLMSGTPHEAAQKASSWGLTNVFRGEHVLEVAVVDGKGGQVAKSEPITVFVFRPSANNRNRRPRPGN